MSEDILKEFYEKDAERFWDPKEGMRGRDLVIYPLMKSLSGRVLEYGCGSGSLLLNLALEDRFSELIGVDLSETALAKVRSHWEQMHGGPKIKLMQPVNDELPQIPSGSVDVLLSLDTIEHVMNPYTVIDELHRVGAPDSTFIISVPNYGYIKYVIQLAMGRQPLTGGDAPVSQWREAGWDGYHIHTFTRQSLGILLRDCGWEPVLWTGYGDKLKLLAPLRKHYPALWSGALTVVCRKRR